jgi:hypothetical protein
MKVSAAFFVPTIFGKLPTIGQGVGPGILIRIP